MLLLPYRFRKFSRDTSNFTPAPARRLGSSLPFQRWNLSHISSSVPPQAVAQRERSDKTIRDKSQKRGSFHSGQF
jgi:hypothetical protein